MGKRLVAAGVVAALGLTGAGVASANNMHHDHDVIEQLKVRASLNSENNHYIDVDGGPDDGHPEVGDRNIYSELLMTHRGEPLGTVYNDCVLAEVNGIPDLPPEANPTLTAADDEPVEPEPIDIVIQCQSTHELEGGNVHVSTLYHFDPIAATGELPRDTFLLTGAITGGTGKFVGAQGQVGVINLTVSDDFSSREFTYVIQFTD